MTLIRKILSLERLGVGFVRPFSDTFAAIMLVSESEDVVIKTLA
jgi:hypothetical protein